MVTLRVLSDYRSRDLAYSNGQILLVDDVLGAWLLRDSPGSFQLLEPADTTEARDVSAPPKDKMMRRSKTK